MRTAFSSLALVLISVVALPAVAQQSASTLHARGLAATCANCHGTDGRTTLGSAVPSLAGMPRDYMLKQLAAFRDGSRPATVMHQLAKGLTEQQIDSVASYFATLKP
ncbi:MAG: c-type cytochrome [Hylemonella sp.]|nr:c-type cytochrome [Hylemonella sp.]MDH5707895.1 c-type cytochrome [Hylemonella sp.]